MASIQESFDRVLKPLSTPALLMLHAEIRRLLIDEDAAPNQTVTRYGMRKFSDFKVEADVIERILRNRNESFDPIPW